MSDRRAKGHPVRGGIFGLIAGFLIGVDLFLFGVVDSDSALITILPVVFAAIGIVLGVTAPIKRRGRSEPDIETVDESAPASGAESDTAERLK
ncbi:MAG TPA: hypothetical protein VGA13_05830 [Acidimicrobiales bacterium]